MGSALSGIWIALQRSTLSTRERCLRRIWDEYHPRMVLFVRGFRFDPETVADLVQEIMEKIFTHLDSYRPAYSFSTWAYRIARNHCFDELRRRKGRIEPRSLEELGEGAQPREAMRPETELARRELEACVREVLDRAEPDLRQVAYLRFQEELSYRQIASVLGIPVGTAKFRAHVVRNRVRLCLGEGGLP